MACLKKTAALALALTMCFAAGCADKSDKDSSAGDVNSASQSGSSADTSDNDNTDSPDNTAADADSASAETSSAEEAPAYSVGENLAKTLALFDGSYTYTAEVTYSDDESVTQVVQASDGESFYQRSTETGSGSLDGDSGYLYDGSQGYDIDYNLKAYSTCDEKTGLNIFELIMENELEQTDTHIPSDTQDMTVEEYTYAGDTYMTVLDFYFNEDGSLDSYTATYSVEGDDDIVQTVEIKSIEQEADASYFDISALDEFTDFGEISEDTRLGFCQGVCATYEISTDNMYEMDITTDDLKRIEFDKFRELVYTYANLK